MTFTPPWNREWLDLSSGDFEVAVVAWLKEEFGGENLKQVKVEHQAERVSADGVRCKLDALVTTRTAGMDYVTVVECKHQGRPVEGEEVDVLATKVRRYGHKGLLVSTGGFQSGARKRARIEKIALVHMTRGGPRWLARDRDGMPGAPESTHDFYLVRTSVDDTASYRVAGRSALLEVLFGAVALPGAEGEPG